MVRASSAADHREKKVAERAPAKAKEARKEIASRCVRYEVRHREVIEERKETAVISEKNYNLCKSWIDACSNRDVILSKIYHDYLLPLVNPHRPDTIISVNQFFKEFGLPIPSPLKDDSTSIVEQV